jgi:hypothetical protein
MAAHGEIQRPPVGKFNDRLWGDSHGHRHPWRVARFHTLAASKVRDVK